MWIRNKDLEKELRQTQSFPEPVPEAQGESLMTAFLKKEAPAELNISKVLERFGSGEIWLDTIRTYVASTPIMLSGLRQTDTENRALQPNPKGEGSLDNYRIIVHGIKGASRAIGAEETGRLAEELERAAKEGNMDFIRSHSKAFTENAANLIARLRKLLETADKLFSKPKKPAPNREILAQLLEAAENFNINEVDKAMEELEKYEYETQGDLVPWLREQVGLSEFEQIQERLSSDLAALSLEAE
jgi:HPt (histidine-containing phosphotransfer) domain-containing protein